MQIEVRLAEARDHDVIVEFNRSLASETEGKALDPAIVREGVRAVLSDRNRGIYYVAEIEGRVAGQLMLTFEWSDWRNGSFWWLQSVFVARESRGRGVFSELMRHVARQAESRPDCCGLRLYVHRHNHPAIQTYRKRGFYPLEYEFYEQGLAADGRGAALEIGSPGGLSVTNNPER